MASPTYPTLEVAVAGSIATITLNRPEVHNAINAEMVTSLTAALRDLGQRGDLRALVLRGAGPSFCAGGDIRSMRASLAWDQEQNLRDAIGLASLFESLSTCPLAVVGVVHGAALGGGGGLVATCDIVLAEEGTKFGFTEARLGLIPATISPYVVAKIGVSQARALFLTAERFDAARALAIGLVHRVVPAGQLEAALAQTLAALRSNGPQAICAAKALVAQVAGRSTLSVLNETARAIAEIRTGAEAQEGLTAFLEKRRADWVEGA